MGETKMTNKEIEEAVKYAESNGYDAIAQEGSWKTLIDLANSYLQASDELPCEKEWNQAEGREGKIKTDAFNECLSIVKPIVAKKDKEIGELVEALQCLYDEQNGAPLIKHQKDWEEAMDKAESALNKHKTINE